MTSHSTEIEHLFDGVRKGNALAMEKLLQKLEPDLRRYARRSCSSADVDDAVQDAMVIIYQRAGALKFLVALSSWLFKIVLRICMRLKKDDAMNDSFDSEAHLDTNAISPSQVIILQQELTKMLMKIDAHYREILLLRDFLGYSAEETAERLNISIDAAKSRLHRARALARKELNDDFRQ